MKSFRLLCVPILLLSAGIFFAGCKKDIAAVESCRIITVTPSSGNVLNFTYNLEGKTGFVTNGNALTVFSYSGNVVIGNTTVNGNFITKKTVVLHPNGFAASAKTETSSDGSTWYKNTYEYNGAQLIKDTYTNSQNVVPQVTTITWSGGNLVATSQNGITSTVEYYTDKPSQQGDYLALLQMIQGYRTYSSKNAVKSLLANGSISSFDYTYQDGKITALKFNAGGTITNYSYQYQCN